MRFYRDLGLTEFYRRPVDPVAVDAVACRYTRDPSCPIFSSGKRGRARSSGERTIPPRKPISRPPPLPPLHPPADRAAALRIIREEIGDCTRCALHKGRNKIVFGDGSPDARLMFVGEGPGADEDAQGLPFVGRAGQLLNNMIAAMGLKREEVYIANIVKCRPPGNRTPGTRRSQHLLAVPFPPDRCHPP